MTKVSVVMATYNGEKYLKQQINSILDNLNSEDELIITDDGSTDNTINIIKSFQKTFSQIIFINGPQKGVKQNFATGIEETSGDVIFLSDQDDIWAKDKVKKVLPYLEHNSVVVHDAVIVNENNKIIEKSFYQYRGSGKGILKNIYKNTYIGCCMAFQRDLKKIILPIPNNIEMHDQWIGIIGEKLGIGSVFISDKLIKYRRHTSNVSSMKHYPLPRMLKNRFIFIKELRRRKK